MARASNVHLAIALSVFGLTGCEQHLVLRDESGQLTAPSMVQFGNVPLYTQLHQELVVRNEGQAPISWSVKLEPPGGPFGVPLGGELVTVAPHTERSIGLDFRPVTLGDSAGQLVLRDEAGKPLLTRAVLGRGVLTCFGGQTCPKSVSPCLAVSGQCVDGLCAYEPLGDNSTCDDDNRCTTDDRCVAGTCRGNQVSACAARPDGGSATFSIDGGLMEQAIYRLGFDLPATDVETLTRPDQVELSVSPIVLNFYGKRKIPNAPVAPINSDEWWLLMKVKPKLGPQTCGQPDVYFELRQARASFFGALGTFKSSAGGTCSIELTTVDLTAKVVRGRFEGSLPATLLYPADGGVSGMQVLNGSFEVELKR